MMAKAVNSPQSMPKETLRWGLGLLTFELYCSEPRVLAGARAIFRPWVCRNDADPFYRWFIESVTDASGKVHWEISVDNSSNVIYRGSVEGVLAMLENLALLAVRDHADGWPDLHGAVVSMDGKGVVIVGAGEAGKSTLACALWQGGWTLLCDDLTLIEVSQRMAYPVPRRISFRHASRPLFPEAFVTSILTTPSCTVASESCLFHPEEVDHRARPPSARIDAIFFLMREGLERARALLQPVQPAQALLAVLPYSSRTRSLGLGAALQLFKPLAESVAAYELSRGPLPEMVACIEEVVHQIR